MATAAAVRTTTSPPQAPTEGGMVRRNANQPTSKYLPGLGKPGMPLPNWEGYPSRRPVVPQGYDLIAVRNFRPDEKPPSWWKAPPGKPDARPTLKDFDDHVGASWVWPSVGAVGVAGAALLAGIATGGLGIGIPLIGAGIGGLIGASMGAGMSLSQQRAKGWKEFTKHYPPEKSEYRLVKST